MVEIQELFFILIIVMGIIGMVRGFLKELGVTLVLIATLFALDKLIPIINNFINGGGFGFLGLGPVPQTQTTDNLLFVLFGAMMVGATYIAYQGETLAYEGSNPRGIVGALLGFLIGAVNGYLLFGTIWWLANFYQYPFGLVSTQTMPTAAQQIINSGLLPMELLGNGATDLTSWGLLPFILVLLVILKVIR
ncbi:MAG TPA: hypothetical protein VMP08_12855 [Anaerolineae bacterium]|nr:hypothetical protein [Anaerolineae bacterium]